MGYIIAYLLLALVIDLVRELVAPESVDRGCVAIHRRLWNDTLFDCRSRRFSVETIGGRQCVQTKEVRKRTI